YNLSGDTSPDGERLNRKLYSIPFAYSIPDKPVSRVAGKVRVFIGISRERSEMKGTDIMLQAARDLQRLYPDRMELLVANGVSFDEYSRMMDSSDVLLDQIYSYGPGMNALLAMSKGIVAVSGAEPEHYELLGENEVMPIVNVYPSYEDVYRNLEKLILNPELVNRLKLQSREYVARNHEYIRVSRQYVELYSKLLG
ncbi:MAG: glycosyltransferase family 1 protein, partial [Bacteroidaceae bacterium]|nr:glycosyltransferase family 1 protein [Bacteroidaceae bacterium]